MTDKTPLYEVGSFHYYYSRDSASVTDGEYTVLKGRCTSIEEPDKYAREYEDAGKVSILCEPESVVLITEYTDGPNEVKYTKKVCQVDKKGEVTCVKVYSDIEYYQNGNISHYDYRREGPSELIQFPPTKSQIARALVKYDPVFVEEAIWQVGNSYVQELKTGAEQSYGSGESAAFFGSEESAVEQFEISEMLEQEAIKKEEQLHNAIKEVIRMEEKLLPRLRGLQLAQRAKRRRRR